MKTREIAVGGLLTALALLIPFAFRGTPLQLFIPTLQYSATFASHVPSMRSMLVSPLVAAMVGLGSASGFTVTLNPVIGARAFTHVIWGVVGAVMIQRRAPFWLGALKRPGCNRNAAPSEPPCWPGSSHSAVLSM